MGSSQPPMPEAGDRPSWSASYPAPAASGAYFPSPPSYAASTSTPSYGGVVGGRGRPSSYSSAAPYSSVGGEVGAGGSGSWAGSSSAPMQRMTAMAPESYSRDRAVSVLVR